MVNIKNGDLIEEVFITIINFIENLLSIYFVLDLNSRCFFLDLVTILSKFTVAI